MRVAKYTRIDTQRVEKIITVGSHEETVVEEVPVMGMVYRDATPEEIAEAERMAAEMPSPEPTMEEQLADLTDLVGILAEVALA